MGPVADTMASCSSTSSAPNYYDTMGLVATSSALIIIIQLGPVAVVL